VAEFIAQAIFHALIAALVVEALLRRWRVEDPRQKVRFRLLSLAFPLVVLPSFEWLAPVRHEEWFHEDWALFVGSSWGQVRWIGLPLFEWWLWAFGLMGALLFLFDALPFLREQIFERGLPRVGEPPPPALRAEVETLCHHLQVPPPGIVFLHTAAPYLLCAGSTRPQLIVSEGTMRTLDDRELRAALAHELGHLHKRDPLLSWALLAARIVQAFNPVLHVIVRAIARDAERRADDVAARLTRDRLAVAGGLLKLYIATQGSQSTRAPVWGPFVTRARSAAVEERCRRLIDKPAPEPVPFESLRLVLTAASLSVLLFFVV
jgi:Zn-dependent protease with chaperone function